MRATDLSRGLQGRFPGHLERLYSVWSKVYDISIRLDPAYQRQLRQMVELVVDHEDNVIDLGCGTGQATIPAAARAKRVVGIDPSAAMTRRLEGKIRRRGLTNIEVRLGFFPQRLEPGESFHSAISSFMLAHLPPPQRALLLQQVYDCLNPGGRLGLFSAQGEVAPSFQTRDELWQNLSGAGFHDIQIRDVSDVYRITTAK